MSALRIRVIGQPAPQGSKRHVGGGRMVESSKAVKPWREAVKWAAGEAVADSNGLRYPTGPVNVTVDFTFRRPRNHYRTGRFADLLRDDAPELVDTKPDIDKLLRSTFDALTDAGVWRDDSQVAVVIATKSYGDAGALIHVTPIGDRT